MIADVVHDGESGTQARTRTRPPQGRHRIGPRQSVAPASGQRRRRGGAAGSEAATSGCDSDDPTSARCFAAKKENSP